MLKIILYKSKNYLIKKYNNKNNLFDKLNNLEFINYIWSSLDLNLETIHESIRKIKRKT